MSQEEIDQLVANSYAISNKEALRLIRYLLYKCIL